MGTTARKAPIRKIARRKRQQNTRQDDDVRKTNGIRFNGINQQDLRKKLGCQHARSRGEKRRWVYKEGKKKSGKKKRAWYSDGNARTRGKEKIDKQTEEKEGPE